MKQLLLALLLYVCASPSFSFAPDDASSGASSPSSPAEWYGEGVRPTDPRTPDDERLGFHLPPGFVAELIAAEPQIAKPLNIAFDPAGRLWISDTVEYPYPAPPDRSPGDSIKTLEDRDHDGDFETITTFADELNIPIGILPIPGGAIAFSIPYIWKLSDVDGDGRCDEREKLVGPFDTSRDAHGMVNAMRMGDDGWIYACHGFNNQSTVSGSDGHSITMNSGNTFRFRADGSRVEHFTHGQVNPFGMAIDVWGNRFTADCHSKPITQLLRGGYYSSFGRPDDGLGMIPPMMDHLHGSTAICGLSIYLADEFPAAYRDQFYSGNVMTSRINRNAILRQGATFKAIELPDFMTSDDPWFRPVDIQLGPDGALYVADFYNKIIGHYEVPLDHPQRDRLRGRIWRIRYAGEQLATDKPYVSKSENSITDATAIERDISQLADSNLTVHNFAMERLATRGPDKIETLLRHHLHTDPDPLVRIGCLWTLHRHNRLSAMDLASRIQDESPLVCAHSVRAAGEQASVSNDLLVTARALINSGESLVEIHVVELLGRNGDGSDVPLLLSRMATVDVQDHILRQTIRIAIRDLLAQPRVAKQIDLLPLLTQSSFADQLAEILLGLHTQDAGRWLLTYLSHRDRELQNHQAAIRHLAKYADTSVVVELIALMRDKPIDWNARRSVLASLWENIKDKPTAGRDSASTWAGELAGEKLHILNDQLTSSPNASVSLRCESGQPWPLQSRAAADGANDYQYYSSFVLGENYVGKLCSGSFPAPQEFDFWIVGHDGFPNKPAAGKNTVRLVVDATGHVIAESAPPRSDIAKLVQWDLSDWRNQSVHFECVDDDNATAYAWLAVGRFSFSPLGGQTLTGELNDLLNLVTECRLVDFNENLLELARHEKLDVPARLRVLQAFAKANSNPAANVLATVLLSFNTEPLAHNALLTGVDTNELDSISADIIKQTAKRLSLADQTKVASLLASERQSLTWLIASLRNATISSDVLRAKDVLQAVEILATADQRAEVETLIAALPLTDSRLDELKASLLAKFQQQSGDATAGAKTYQLHCAACHQLAGQGALVGPQLDGAIVRSIDRLLEDIVTPDRNVDLAFRTTTILLDDGTVRVGLLRQETAESIELVDQQGKPSSLNRQTIESRIINTRSLMPSGLAEAIGERGMCDLISYLRGK